MQFTIKRNILVECLKNINTLIDTNNLNPLLANVHIKTNNDKLIFIATNGTDNYQQTISEVEIKKPGDILVKAKLLLNYISKINQENITITQVDERLLQIKTPKSNFDLNLADDSSFPILNFEYKGWKKINLSYDTLLNISSKIKPFVCTSYTNTNLATSGILFNPIDEKQYECVASDSFRMAYYKFDYSGDPVKFILPPKAIDMAIDVLNNKKLKSVDIFLSEKHCILNIENILIQFSLYKDTYPNIIKAILAEQKHSFTIKVDDLFDALNRGLVVVGDEQRPIANFKIENNKLNIKFISNQTGNSLEQIDLIKSNIDTFEIKLNLRLFLSLINTIKTDTITFNFNGSNAPIILTSDNPYLLNLIVPLRSL